MTNEGRFVYGFSEGSKDMKDLKAGDKITIEGSSGRVVEGEVPLVDPELSEDLSEEALSKLEPL